MLEQFDFLYLRSGKAHERQATTYLLLVIIVFRPVRLGWFGL